MEREQDTHEYRKYAVWTGVFFVLLLAIAGAIWGAEFVLQQMDLSLKSRADAIFLGLVVAMGFALLLLRQAANELGPSIRLYVFRPDGLAAKDGVTARWRTVNLPYPINDGMALTLNEREISGPEIYAEVVAVDRFISPPENDAWVIATLELDDPNDFDRLGASTEWYEVRDNTVQSPEKAPEPAAVAASPKALQ